MPSSTRSTRAASRTATATASATCRASPRRLEYVEQLGVDAIWISPFCKSPMKDYGYDVADYCAVDPLFGTLADFDALLAEAHRLGPQGDDGLRAVSHTSDQHRLVPGEPAEPRQPQGRLVRLGRPQARRHAAQQLAVRVRRQRLGVGAAPRPVLPAQLPQGAARPQLPQPAGDRGAARRRPASGSSAASTASGSTRSISASTTRSCATTRRAAARAVGGSAPGSPFAMQHQLWNKARPELIELFLKPLHALTERYDGKVVLGEISGDDALLRAAEYTNGGGLDIAYSFDLLSCPGTPKGIRGTDRAAGEDHRRRLGLLVVQQPRRPPRRHPLGRRRPARGPAPAGAGAAGLACAARSASTRARSWAWRRPSSPSSSSRTRSASPSGPPSPAATAAARRCPGQAAAPEAGFTAGEPWLPVPESHRRRAVDVQDARRRARCCNTTRAFLNWRRERQAAAHRRRSAFLRAQRRRAGLRARQRGRPPAVPVQPRRRAADATAPASRSLDAGFTSEGAAHRAAARSSCRPGASPSPHLD